MAHSRFIHEILHMSEASDWEAARREWVIKLVYFSKAPATCLCGHYPISELCIVSNKKNHNEATVGSCCVKKFMELPSNKIFDAVKRVKKKADTSLNEETITHLYKQKLISMWEYEFYIDTCRKRKLSSRQIATRKKINEKILAIMEKNQAEEQSKLSEEQSKVTDDQNKPTEEPAGSAEDPAISISAEDENEADDKADSEADNESKVDDKSE